MRRSSTEAVLWALSWGGAFAAVLCVALALALGPAHGGEIVECADARSAIRPLWREIDGRQCWFAPEPGVRRGREKPTSELRWGPPPLRTTTDDIPEEPAKMRPPWEVEYRWPEGQR
jgi:hypothetical protein